MKDTAKAVRAVAQALLDDPVLPWKRDHTAEMLIRYADLIDAHAALTPQAATLTTEHAKQREALDAGHASLPVPAGRTRATSDLTGVDRDIQSLLDICQQLGESGQKMSDYVLALNRRVIELEKQTTLDRILTLEVRLTEMAKLVSEHDSAVRHLLDRND